MIRIYECPSCHRTAQKTYHDELVCCGVRMILTATYESIEEYERMRGYF